MREGNTVDLTDKDHYKEAIDAFDHLLDVLERVDKDRLSVLQKHDLIVYTEVHLGLEMDRITQGTKVLKGNQA